MTMSVWGFGLSLLLLLVCQANTIVIRGQVVTCIVCCDGGICTTNCF